MVNNIIAQNNGFSSRKQCFLVIVTQQTKSYKVACHSNAKGLIHGIDHEKWRNEGFDLCLDGLHVKFTQNKDLIAMLKTTEPKLLIEVSNNKLWGTGIPLKDSHVLNDKRWNSKG